MTTPTNVQNITKQTAQAESAVPREIVKIAGKLRTLMSHRGIGTRITAAEEHEVLHLLMDGIALVKSKSYEAK